MSNFEVLSINKQLFISQMFFLKQHYKMWLLLIFQNFYLIKGYLCFIVMLLIALLWLQQLFFFILVNEEKK